MLSAKIKYQTIDEYIQTFPKDIQEILEVIRQTIKEVIPEAEELISYQIPAFKLDGSYVIYFAGWKNHVSLYPVTDEVKEKFKKEISSYKTSKGTIQFPLDEPMPLKLITKITKLKVKENSEKQKRKK